MLIELALVGRLANEGVFANLPEPPEVEFIRQAKAFAGGSYPLHAVFFLITTLFADNSVRQLKLASNPEKLEKHHRTALTKWQHIGPADKKNWPLFHRFGPKIARLFLHWVDKYDLAELKNVNKIGGVVDFQAARLMIQAGGLVLNSPEHKAKVLDQTLIPALDEIYEEIANERGIPTYFIHETLWLIGSLSCNNYEHDSCPLQSVCSSLISRKPFDRQGLFDPADSGRYITRKGKIAQQKRERRVALGQQEFYLDKI